MSRSPVRRRPVRTARLLAVLLALTALVCCTFAATAAAASSDPLPRGASTALPLYPVPNLTGLPPGFSATPAQALRTAKTSPTLLAIHRIHHPLHWVVDYWPGKHYELFFSFRGTALADVIVSRDGRLGATFTGPLVIAEYARGHYDGLFDSPWVLGPFIAMFLLPLLARRPGWGQLDIALVLSFFLSYELFDHAMLEAAVWTVYVSLGLLAARMLLRARRTSAATPLGTWMPTALLAGGLVALLAARIGLTIAHSGVIDVGTASTLGAFKLLHGQSLYYTSSFHGDTYGPITYLAYVPFELLWPGHWGSLPAARVAAIAFDLLTVAGLILLGRRSLGGRGGLRAGLLMAWLWAACPFTLLGLINGTNDGLVALLVVGVALALRRPALRGVLLGLAAAAKFTPAILLGIVLRGRGARAGSWRTARIALAGFILAAAVPILVFLPAGGVKEFWDHTIGYQLNRADVFSIWALHPGLEPIKVAVELAVAALAVLLAVRPAGTRTFGQVAAAGAVLLVVVQAVAVHWFYFYIVWFVPFILAAVVCGDGGDETAPRTGADVGDPIFELRPTAPEPVLAGLEHA